MLWFAFNNGENCHVRPIVVVVQLGDTRPALRKEIAAEFPHDGKLSFVSMVAGWKKM